MINPKDRKAGLALIVQLEEIALRTAETSDQDRIDGEVTAAVLGQGLAMIMTAAAGFIAQRMGEDDETRSA